MDRGLSPCEFQSLKKGILLERGFGYPEEVRQPTLQTARLELRALQTDDAPRIRALAGDAAVARTTLLIPHPYPKGMADRWIASTHSQWLQQQAATFGVVLRETNEFIGATSLKLSLEHQRAELGYWIGRPYWNQGYGTEAAREMVRFGFEEMGLNRIFAEHFRENASSGRILRKIGMRPEGRLEQHVLKEGSFIDLELYGLLKQDWLAQKFS